MFNYNSADSKILKQNLSKNIDEGPYANKPLGPFRFVD